MDHLIRTDPDWCSAEAYYYTLELTKEQWAWQFLRRNPEYQRDWLNFITRWKLLEKDYGIAPNRDFLRWKEDSRAYAAEYDIDAIGIKKNGSIGKIADDQILIECWMGAKWGFYKFPQNPALFSPKIPDDLLWREQGIDLERIAQQALLSQTDNFSTLYFDLNLPLKEQLLKAKQMLIREQRTLRDRGVLKHRLQDYVVEWTLLLRYLDAMQLDIAQKRIEEKLQHYIGKERAFFSMNDLVRQADEMLEYGYLALLVH